MGTTLLSDAMKIRIKRLSPAAFLPEYAHGPEEDALLLMDMLMDNQWTGLLNLSVNKAQKVKDSGLDQQMGPLNPYERRIVHLAVAEIPGVATESVGDAFSKTILISLQK